MTKTTEVGQLKAARAAYTKAAASTDLSLTKTDDPRRLAAENADPETFQRVLQLEAKAQ